LIQNLKGTLASSNVYGSDYGNHYPRVYGHLSDPENERREIQINTKFRVQQQQNAIITFILLTKFFLTNNWLARKTNKITTLRSLQAPLY